MDKAADYSSSDMSDSESLEDVPLTVLPAPSSKPKMGFQMPALALATPNSVEPLPTSRRPVVSSLRLPAHSTSDDRPLPTHRDRRPTYPPALSIGSNTARQAPQPPVPRIEASEAAEVDPKKLTWVYLLSPAFAVQTSPSHDTPDGVSPSLKQWIFDRFKSSFGMEARDLSLLKVSSLGASAPGQPVQIAVHFNGKGFTTQNIEGLLTELNSMQATNQALQNSNNTLQNELQALQVRNRSLQDEVTTLQAENKTLQAAQTSHTQTTNNMYEDLRKWQEDVRRLQANIASLQEERIRLTNENTVLATQEKASKQESAHLKQEIQNLRDYASKCDSDRYQMKSVLQGLQSQFRAVVYGNGGVHRATTAPAVNLAPAPSAPALLANGVRSSLDHAPSGYSESFLSSQIADTWMQQNATGRGGQQAISSRVQQPITGHGVQQTAGRGGQQAAHDSAHQAT